MSGTIYLIPNLLSETNASAVIPEAVRQQAIGIKHYVVENVKVGRRYLKKLDRAVDIDAITFYDMGKHGDDTGLSQAISAAKAGHDVGVLSDAGCPGVADPGAVFIGMAHRAGLRVSPLVGPSSILLAVMAAGLNGQSFTFHGYAPKDRGDRQRFFKQICQRINAEGSSHLFMDTPFRNAHLLEDLLKACPDELRLCIARDITGDQEWIRTLSIRDWKKQKAEIHKVPVMFVLGR